MCRKTKGGIVYVKSNAKKQYKLKESTDFQCLGFVKILNEFIQNVETNPSSSDSLPLCPDGQPMFD